MAVAVKRDRDTDYRFEVSSQKRSRRLQLQRRVPRAPIWSLVDVTRERATIEHGRRLFNVTIARFVVTVEYHAEVHHGLPWRSVVSNTGE